VTIIAPVAKYPGAHVNVHVGLFDATPPEHEAPAVVVVAVTLMAEQSGPRSRVGSGEGFNEGFGEGFSEGVGEGFGEGNGEGWPITGATPAAGDFADGESSLLPFFGKNNLILKTVTATTAATPPKSTIARVTHSTRQHINFIF